MGLKAAWADARPDGYPDIFRPGSEEPDHLRRGFGGEVQGGAPPPGMDRADGPGHRVEEQQDDTVRGENHQARPRRIRYQGVGLVVQRDGQALAGVAGGDAPYCVLMDLAAENNPAGVRAKGGCESAVVLCYPVPVVTLRSAEAEIHRGEHSLRHTAQTGGKAVDQAGTVQQGGGVINHASTVM